MSQLKGTYPESENGNYYVRDTIPVPHPYCIGPRHVAHAADNFGGLLTAESIEDGEKRGIVCDICKGELTHAQHEIALLIGCRAPLPTKGTTDSELHRYLKAIVAIAESNGYAGFAFIDERKSKTI